MIGRIHGVIAVLLIVAACPSPAFGRAPGTGAGGGKLLTVDYVGAELADVLRAIAAQSKANVAISPAAKGQVTVHLRERTVDEAIQVVANLAGVAARKVSDTYVIAPRADMRGMLERLGTTRVVPVTNIPAKEAVDLVQGAYPDLTARPQGKAVALTGTAEDLEAGAKLLRENDTVAPESIRCTEKLAVRNRPAKEAAAALAKMVPGLTAEAAGSDVVLAGTQLQVESGKKGLELLDVPAKPDQETRLYPVRYTAAAELVALLGKSCPNVEVFPGPDSYAPRKPVLAMQSGQLAGLVGANTSGSSNNQQSGSQSVDSAGASDKNGYQGHALSLVLRGKVADLDEAVKVLSMVDVPAKQLIVEARVAEVSPEDVDNLGVQWEWNKFQFTERPNSDSTSGPLGFGSFGRSSFNPLATLNMMVTKKTAKILASPHIRVLNDQDASMFIGETLRIRVLATSSATAGSTYTVYEIPVGIVLLVRPRVNDDGYITARVHPVVSTLVNTPDENNLPQTAAREADTTVRVKDGETLVIGGLIQDSDSKTMSKIPLLGDLPLVGQLFRNQSRTHKRTEVLVFVTIRLAKD